MAWVYENKIEYKVRVPFFGSLRRTAFGHRPIPRGQAKVRSLDLTRLGVEALPSIWSFEASGRTALDFSGPADGVGSGARFVRDGHLQLLGRTQLCLCDEP